MALTRSPLVDDLLVFDAELPKREADGMREEAIQTVLGHVVKWPTRTVSQRGRRNREQMQLNRLLTKLPRLQQEFPDPADFWPAFAGLADLILDAAGPDDLDWIACQINAMLEARGLLVR